MFSKNRVPKGTKRSMRATQEDLAKRKQKQEDRRDIWGTKEARMANRRKKQELKNSMREKELAYKTAKLNQNKLANQIRATGQALGQAGIGVGTPIVTGSTLSNSKSSQNLVQQGNALVTASSGDDQIVSDER